MTSSNFFNTDPRYVTPVGIWLSTRLNKGLYAASFVARRTYDSLTRDYRRLSDEYDRLEDAYVSEGESLLKFPSDRYDYSLSIREDEYDFGTLYEYRLEPLRGGTVVPQYIRASISEQEEYVKELLIRQTGEAWKRKGEDEMRRFLESVNLNDNRKVRKISKY